MFRIYHNLPVQSFTFVIVRSPLPGQPSETSIRSQAWDESSTKIQQASHTRGTREPITSWMNIGSYKTHGLMILLWLQDKNQMPQMCETVPECRERMDPGHPASAIVPLLWPHLTRQITSWNRLTSRTVLAWMALCLNSFALALYIHF